MNLDRAVAVNRSTEAVLSRDQRHRAKAMRAILISSGGLTLTSLFELVIALLSGSVALLADSLHNLGDVFTTVGIYFGFRLSRRSATTRFPYGYGRAEDLAGVVVVAAIWVSAGVALYQSYEKFVSGRPTTDLAIGMVAAVIGIVGNQIVARYKSRVGREINSSPLIVDAKHSLLDSAASAGALVGLIGVALGFPAADPIAGVAIGLLIVHIGIDATGEVAARLMDANDEELAHRAGSLARGIPGVEEVTDVRARWLGREVEVRVAVHLAPHLSMRDAKAICGEVELKLRNELEDVHDVVVLCQCHDTATTRVGARMTPTIT
jgi:cation diffusion facilitator family transporter